MNVKFKLIGVRMRKLSLEQIRLDQRQGKQIQPAFDLIDREKAVVGAHFFRIQYQNSLTLLDFQ